MTVEQIIFLAAAFATLVAAGLVVSTRKILHAALWLVAALFGVAVIFALLQASFLAVIQVVVYVGAIAILVIFAVMLTRRVMIDTGPQVTRIWPIALLVSLAVVGGLVWLLSNWPGFNGAAPALTNDSAAIVELGVQLVSPDGYMVPFEVASVLLLAALVGAIFVARITQRNSR
jgi:NADH-quinone oxidoreductase subunit J